MILYLDLIIRLLNRRPYTIDNFVNIKTNFDLFSVDKVSRFIDNIHGLKIEKREYFKFDTMFLYCIACNRQTLWTNSLKINTK